MKRTAIMLLLLCLGCGKAQDSSSTVSPEAEPSPHAPPPPGISVVEAQEPGSTAPPVATQSEEPAPTIVVAYTTMTDIHGMPLPGINPIVTVQANAFDKPLAVGEPTGSDGKSSVRFLSEKNLFLRAWDPKGVWFPNNVLEIPAKSGNVAHAEIQMVRAAALRAHFYVAGGTPAANLRIELMMAHPHFGDWWPAECQTDAEGVGIFTNIPPGKYALQFRAGESGTANQPEVLIMPGEALELGDVSLF